MEKREVELKLVAVAQDWDGAYKLIAEIEYKEISTEKITRSE